MTKNTLIESALSLKITLEGTRPAIWRSVLVPVDSTLGHLHEVIQSAMGWEDCHLYDFMTGTRARSGLRYQHSDDEDEFFYGIRIRSVLPKVKSKIGYVYDFGDGWHHRIVFEKITEVAPGQRLPVCTGGKNACPPEDSGGLWGYYGKLESLADPDDEYHGETKEWLGKDFDPSFFDMDEANRRLADIRRG